MLFFVVQLPVLHSTLFAFTLWYASMRLLRFNLLVFIQEHILRLTQFISFNAICFRSTIYCTTVERKKLVDTL